MREAVIVSAVRTAIGKAPRGALRNVHTADLAATAIKAALERTPGLDPKEIDDVILGCAMPEAEQGRDQPRPIPGHGIDRRECRSEVWRQPRGSGCLRAALASARGGGNRVGQVQG